MECVKEISGVHCECKCCRVYAVCFVEGAIKKSERRGGSGRGLAS